MKRACGWRRVALPALFAAMAAQAQPLFENGWLRPAAAGQANAAVYVDIRSTEPLSLVGASSPVAKRVELVANDKPGLEGFARVVPALPVTADGTTRLAYLGSHLRLVDVTRDVMPGEVVDVDLVFEDPAGVRRSARFQAVARGIAARPGAPTPAP